MLPSFGFSFECHCKVTMDGSMERLLSDEEVTEEVAAPTKNELFHINDKLEALASTRAKRYYSGAGATSAISVSAIHEIYWSSCFFPDDKSKKSK